MAFAGVNYIAVLLAAVASYVFGALWYTSLAKPWMAAAGLTEEQIRGAKGKGPSAVPFIIAFVAQLVMAFVLAGVIGHLGPGNITLKNGLISALLVWGGFVITTLAVNHQFQMASPRLTLIDGSHWLGVLAIQGLVIGFMGV